MEDLLASIAACLKTSFRVLLLDPNEETRSSLGRLLMEEGYAVTGAASSEEAQEFFEARCFHLLLANLPGGPSFGGLAHQLLRLSRPTPVGVITDQPLHPGAEMLLGLAFYLPRSVDQRDLLRLMQSVINPPLSEEQQRQVGIVRRFFTAIETADWERMTSLCHQDFVCYPPVQSKAAFAQELRGALAYRNYQETVRRQYPGYHAEEELLYPQMYSIAARYRFGWLSPEGASHQLTIGKLVRFKDRLIHEMRLWFTPLRTSQSIG